MSPLEIPMLKKFKGFFVTSMYDRWLKLNPSVIYIFDFLCDFCDICDFYHL